MSDELGPLSGLAGTWEGEKGTDKAPDDDRFQTETNEYRERMTFAPTGLVENHEQKLYGLRIAPSRLQQIRQERRPGSRYASTAQVQFETRAAESLFQRHGIASLDTTECSIEEISARILEATGIERRVRP